MASDSVFATFPNRTFTRARGCYNCSKWENGAQAKQHYQSRRLHDEIRLAAAGVPEARRLSEGDREGALLDAAKLAACGMTADEAVSHVLGLGVGRKFESARFQAFNRMSDAGQIGICLIGKAKSDFVHFKYLCDSWSGRDGASVATEGHKLDKLPEELREMLDGPTDKK